MLGNAPATLRGQERAISGKAGAMPFDQARAISDKLGAMFSGRARAIRHGAPEAARLARETPDRPVVVIALATGVWAAVALTVAEE
jgi:hypothetical protein